jgi:polysaccharide pyruvyl transferase WcaK-like protein
MAAFLIVNGYSARNAGDAAIVLATGEVLRAHGASSVTTATRYHEADREFYARHGFGVVPPAIPFPPRGTGRGSGRVARLLGGLAAAWTVVGVYRLNARLGRALASALRLRGLVALLDSDRVIACGGGYMYSGHQRVNLTLIHALTTIKLAAAAGKRPLMMPQSIGPLPKQFDRRLLGWALDDVRPVVVRDRPAEAEAEEVLAERRADIVLCPDIAFYGWSRVDEAEPAVGPEDKPAIGIVVMDWTWARPPSPGALERYVDKLATVTRGLRERGYTVHLLGHARVPEQNQDDVAVAHEIAGRVPGDGVRVVDVGWNVEQVQNVLASMDAVIGTRLHSCIISLSSGTPAVGLAYQPKTAGTYELLGLGDLCFDVETFGAEEVIETVDRVASSRDEYRRRTLEAVERVRSEIDAFYAQQLNGAPRPQGVAPGVRS